MEFTIQTLKKMVRNVPRLGPFLVHLREKRWKSSEGWDRRYRRGGNSGAGSYHRLAQFKAEFLNRFVFQQRVTSVIEFGSGDGSQLKLACYPEYVGVDVSSKAVELCTHAFSHETSKTFLHSSAYVPGTHADLALSLDVIYHLVEDEVYEVYMWQLFGSARHFVIVYSSNEDKNTSSIHIRHRRFTDWVERYQPGWYLKSTLQNAFPYDADDPEHTSFADFYVFARRSSPPARLE